MHAHHLVKGLDGADVLEVEAITRQTWERATGAYIVEVAELISAGAAIAYLGLHHRKPEQAPPRAWRGMRFRASQGYWSAPVAELRERARTEQRRRRLAWRYTQDGTPTSDADELAAIAVAGQDPPGRLVRVREGKVPAPR
jgi:hypothetical protein